MDFIDEVKERSGRFANRLQHPIETEEATKTSFVLPFIQMLGYDIFDPSEVIPEFTADVGTKRNEKVDYALMQDGRPVVLIEAKRYDSNLDEEDTSQLLRYFGVTETRFGILTDGINYRFFADLVQPNQMDNEPFFEFNMLEFSESQVKELKRFTKSAFQPHETIDAARQLKYMGDIKAVIAREISEPSDEFVRFFGRQIYGGRMMPGVLEMFRGLVHDAFTEHFNERFDARLNSALQRIEGEKQDAQPPEHVEVEPDTQRESPGFSELEMEALGIIKAVLYDVVDVQRIALRQYTRHTSVLLDDSRFKTICWFRFAPSAIQFGIFGNDESYQLESLDKLYDHTDVLKARLGELSNPEATA